jgi:hypothetical protein
MAEETAKINIEAEKTVFNDALVNSGTYRDMIPDTANTQKIEMPELEFSALPNEKPIFSMSENMEGIGQDYSAFKSESLSGVDSYKNSFTSNLMSSDFTPTDSIKDIFTSSSQMNADNILRSDEKNDSLVNSKLMSSNIFIPGLEQIKTKKIEDKINSQIMPSIKSLSSKISELGTANKNQNSLIEQRPTNSPTNLIFEDRSKKASEMPYWA